MKKKNSKRWWKISQEANNKNTFKELLISYDKNHYSFSDIEKYIYQFTDTEIIAFYESLLKSFRFRDNKNINEVLSDTNKFLKNNVDFTSDFVIWINSSKFVKTIFDEEGKHEVDNVISLGSSVEGVFQTPYYNGPIEQYAVSWYRLIKNHPFTNGNKRSAFISVKTSLIIDIISKILLIEKDKFKKKLKQNTKDNSKNFKKAFKANNNNKFNEKKFKKFKTLYKKSLIDFFDEETKIFIYKEIEKIVDIWTKKNISDDYIISLWIANSKENKDYSTLKESEYKILTLNLLIFLYNNQKVIYINISNFFNNLQSKIDKKYSLKGKFISNLIKENFK